MRPITYILYFLLSLLCIESLSSQQVKQEGKYIYIDCSNMPYKARRITLPAASHNEKSMDNRVPKRLAVATADVSTSKLTQAQAQAECAKYAGPNGGEAGRWRVPTQREAMRIGTFKTKLEQITGFTKFKTVANTEVYYWASTQSSEYTTYGWIIRFEEYCLTRYEPSNYTHYVRCVRDY